MLDIKKIEQLEILSSLKQGYFATASAPLDGMWHFGFVPMAQHYGFYENEDLIGYCCINGEGFILQFYLSDSALTSASDLFALITQNNSAVIGSVNGAFVSTAEAHYLSLCLDNSSAVSVNALMYRHAGSKPQVGAELKVAQKEQLEDFVEFAVSSIGAPEQWLTGYFSNLIERQELFGYWKAGKLIASGECRLFDTHQTEFADLGMIVAQSERGKGIATQVLHTLVNHALEKGLTPICSTEKHNVGAQKAIANAGLASKHRILQVTFNHS